MLVEILFITCIYTLVYFIIYTKHIIKSVLLLITLALLFSFFLLSFGINFLGLLYLAVYVGAVTVFFLFVVMMCDFTIEEHLSTPNNNILLIKNIKFFSIIIMSYFTTGFLFLLFVNTQVFNSANLFMETIDNFDINIEKIGFYFFNEHSSLFLITGIIILITLVGSIFIATNFSKDYFLTNNHQFSISQDMDEQLTNNFLTSLNLTIFKPNL